MREPKVEMLKAPKEKAALDWKAIAYLAAKARFKFNIYGRKEGSLTRYGISKEMPKDYFWDERKEKPKDISFEEAKTPKWYYLRILKGYVPEMHKYAMMKIPRAVGAL